LAEESEEATVVPAGQEETEDTGETTGVESNLPRLENLVRLPSMFDRETVVSDPHFVCSATHLCKSVGNQTSMMSLCINCNRSAHHFCAEYLSEQPPVKESLVIMVKGFSKEHKVRYKKIPSAKKCDIMFCILCKYRWKAIKVSAAAKIAVTATAKIAAKTSEKNMNKSSTHSGDRARKKKTKLTTASVTVIQELRCVAAFYSQVYIFTKVEKAKANHRFALMIEEHFYDNPLKRIKGACEMLLEGESPFAALYNIIEGEFDRELILKASCCRKDTAFLYVAGVHFSVEDARSSFNH